METPRIFPVIDAHCHLDFPEFDGDREQVIGRAKAGGVECIINAGSTLETSARAVELARRNGPIYACVGCHPHDADGFDGARLEALEALCAEKKVVGIGETGLDYYRNLSSPDNQRRVFEALIDLARRRSLPLVVHTRNAQEDTLAVLRAKSVNRALIHCFSGDAAFLAACLDLGLYISFACNITFKKAGPLREMVKACPLDRICVETDAPYLSPEGHRGKRNEPWACRRACEEVAAVKGLPVEDVARATTSNARTLFGI